MSRTELSHGHHAKVYKVTAQEKLLFPHADIARSEVIVEDVGENSFKTRYYELKIASLLFPRHFIDVVGASRGEITPVSYYGFDFNETTNWLFSQEEPVPQRHTEYAAHVQLNKKTRRKESHLNCTTCSIHNTYHGAHLLNLRAHLLAKRMEKAGIRPPANDPSDYCVSSKKGKGLIFFEVDNFNIDQVEAYINSRKRKTGNIRRATSLVKRYRELQAKA